MGIRKGLNRAKLKFTDFNLKDAKEVSGDYLRANLDTGLSAFGMDNVINDDSYKSRFSKGFGNVSNVTGAISKAALPLAATAIGGPAGGQIASGLQSVGGMANPEDSNITQSDELGNEIGGLASQAAGLAGGFQGGIPTARHGGIMDYRYGGQPNAEVEKQELMQYPDGSTHQVDGPPHEQGGVPVNIPGGTKIYSDTMKIPGDKKRTFAKEAEKYKSDKQDKILTDNSTNAENRSSAKFIQDLKQKKLDQLFETQENLKYEKMNKYASKLGLDPTQFRRGGEVPKYYDGGQFGSGYGASYSPVPNQSTSTSFDPDSSSASPYKPETYAQSTPQGTFDNKGSIVNPNQSGGGGFDKGAAAMGLLNSAGSIYNLATNKKPDPVQYERVAAQTYDPSQAIRDTRSSNRALVKDIRNTAGGSGAAYMSSRIGAENVLRKNLQRTRSEYENRNAEAINRANVANAQIANRETDATAADMARYRDVNRDAIAGLGESASGAIKDSRLTSRDKETQDLISKMYKDYDLINGKWVKKTTKK